MVEPTKIPRGVERPRRADSHGCDGDRNGAGARWQPYLLTWHASLRDPPASCPGLFFQSVAPTKTAPAAIFNEVKIEAILKRHLVKWLQSLDHDSRRSYKFLFE